MKSWITERLFLFFMVLGVITIPMAESSNIVEVDTHFAQYSHIASAHHDNIDDLMHSHTHKHDEDGEEHEHHHSHLNSSQSNLVFITSNYLFVINDSILVATQFFDFSSLLPSDYIFTLFRPPIV